MNGLIRGSLGNAYAVTVMALTIIVLGGLTITQIPIDILPVFKSPAVQVLTFYNGMPADSIEKDITARMERWCGQASGTTRQESRSILGASIVRDFFRSDVDPNGALTQVNSLALAAVPNLPPGTLPPVVLPFDPTSVTPVCVVALDSTKHNESILYDVGRYEVRNFIMAINGAVAPVVFGGKIRAVMVYLDREKLQARKLSPLDVMKALDDYNIFLPTGDAKFGDLDFAIDSNSMYPFVEQMGDIPLRTDFANSAYMRDIAVPEDAAFIQMNIVRVKGRKQVYIPVYRQLGASTLGVVDTLRDSLKDMETRLTRSNIQLNLVMDQSVYVRQSIASLVQEGVLGAILCSLTILLFLGEWRMTAIAVMTIPISVLAAIIFLFYTGNTINVMTLAGLSLAIGPLVDSAIICLENTHRHLGLGATPNEAAFLGASEVAMPELVSSLCTLLVLSPLALMPGMGEFLFRPMAMAVAFAMMSAYFLSRTFVPSRSALWLKGHGAHGPGHEVPEDHGLFAPIRKAFAKWEGAIDAGIAQYVKGLDFVLKHRVGTIVIAFSMLVAVLLAFGLKMRREFFPEVDSGAFEMIVRGQSGLRIEETERLVEQVEKALQKTIGDDLELIISEIGVTADWSAAYTPNSGPMDTIMKVQLKPERKGSAQEYVLKLRKELNRDFRTLEFGFDAGGMIRGAMNEGKSTPINIRVTGKNLIMTRRIAELMQQRIVKVDGIVDARIKQRLDYPEFIINVDRAKAADLGLTQREVMQNVISGFNSSIQFNKRNFWIDPISHNQYFVGVQYPEADIKSIQTLLDVPITSPVQAQPIPLRNIAKIDRATVPTEITHYNLQPTIELTMGVQDRDLGHVADDVTKIVKEFGEYPQIVERLERERKGIPDPDGPVARFIGKVMNAIGVGEDANTWVPFDPDSKTKKTLSGFNIVLSGEYARMQDTFRNLALGLTLASLLIYFLMVALDKSYIVPLTVMSIVPLCLVGIVLMLYFTGTSVNVQSLLGFIFTVGIKVANTVLMTDFAQELRREEGLTPTQAIRKAASIRVRPVTMTAVAAFFALIPAAMALERGSEANAPLGRAILGGLLAGEPATLFVLPAVYSLMIRDPKGYVPTPHGHGGHGGHGHESGHGEAHAGGEHADTNGYENGNGNGDGNGFDSDPGSGESNVDWNE